MIFHLKVPPGGGAGPRFAIGVFGGVVPVTIAQDPKDSTITHIQISGLNYTVDSVFDDVAAALGIDISDQAAQKA